jgi:two-component system sensor histidine kinase QseC
MNSIRRRLCVALVITLALVFGAGGSVVYLVTWWALQRDLDLSLASAASRVIPAMRYRVEAVQIESVQLDRKAGPVEVELDREPGVYAQMWAPDRAILARSASLAAADLPFPATGTNQGPFQIQLPNHHSGRAVVFNSTLESFEALKRSLKERTSLESTKAGAKDELVLADLQRRALNLPRSFLAMVVVDQNELDSGLHRLAQALLGVGLFMLLLTTALVTVISRRGLAPLEALAGQARNIDANTLHQRFPTANLPRELRSICERLNDLLSRLQDAFNRERRFSGDAAHELRTPIAELRAIGEVALKWPSPDPTIVKAFEDVVSAAVQMQGIVEGLLAIARCEAGTQPILREATDLAAIVREVWAPFAIRARSQGFNVDHLLSEGCRFETDPAMLRLILNNLFSNALDYTVPAGKVRIALERSGQSIYLAVQNSVSDLTQEDLRHLFQRFWRKDAARTSSQHSGIGLSVSLAYAEALGLGLTARLTGDNLLEMQLDFRVAAGVSPAVEGGVSPAG